MKRFWKELFFNSHHLCFIFTIHNLFQKEKLQSNFCKSINEEKFYANNFSLGSLIKSYLTKTKINNIFHISTKY